MTLKKMSLILNQFNPKQLLIQITFATGSIRWGWTPPQFQNVFINS